MAGLLDFLNSDDARLGIALMGAGGPTTDPNKTGIGQRVQTAFDTLSTQKSADIKNDYMKSLMEQASAEAQLKQQKATQDAAMNDVFMNIMKQATGQGAQPAPNSPTVAMPGRATAPGAPPIAAGAPPLAPDVPPASADSPQGIMAITQAIARGQQQAQAPQAPQAQPQAPGQPGPSLAPGAMPFQFSQGIPGMPGMTPAVIAASAFVKPEMASAMGNLYKTFSTPVEMKAGFNRDPVTGQIFQVPDLEKGQYMDANGTIRNRDGAVAASAQMAGAVEGAKQMAGVLPAIARKAGETAIESANTLVPVLAGPNGAETSVTRQQFIDGNKANPGTYVQKLSPRIEGFNTDWRKATYQPVIDAGGQANDQLKNLEAIDSLKDARTGLGADKLMKVGSAWTALMGEKYTPELVQKYTADMQKYNSVVLRDLLNTYKSQKGVQTDQDAERIMRAFPNIHNTPEANAFVIDLTRALARQQVAKAEFYENGRMLVDSDPRFGGDYGNVDKKWREYSKGHSLFDDPDMAKWQNMGNAKK